MPTERPAAWQDEEVASSPFDAAPACFAYGVCCNKNISDQTLRSVKTKQKSVAWLARRVAVLTYLLTHSVHYGEISP